MKAMVLAAGFGKRLSPLTDTLPKPLIKVGDQSLIQRNINYLIDNGFSEIIINVSHHSDQVINHVKEIFPNINILFSIEDKPLGTGGGILKALPLIGTKPFLLINSDIFHNIDIKDLPQDTKAAHLIGVPNPEHNADGDFSLKKDLIEIKDGKNSLTWCGISIINPIIFNESNFESKSFNIWDTVLPSYIEEGVVTGEESLGLWVDVGTPERLKLANSVYNDK
tara:strand:- start:392 stop:1060 length:669 start_codon:yes stop_codon:yes gene_type:complete